VTTRTPSRTCRACGVGLSRRGRSPYCPRCRPEALRLRKRLNQRTSRARRGIGRATATSVGAAPLARGDRSATVSAIAAASRPSRPPSLAEKRADWSRFDVAPCETDPPVGPEPPPGADETLSAPSTDVGTDDEDPVPWPFGPDGVLEIPADEEFDEAEVRLASVRDPSERARLFRQIKRASQPWMGRVNDARLPREKRDDAALVLRRYTQLQALLRSPPT
jgi:hypothetical protein